jgi:hypothetical protein
MDKKSVALARIGKKKSAPVVRPREVFEDLGNLYIAISELRAGIRLSRLALVGAVHEAVEAKAPTEEVHAFVEPVVDRLHDLHVIGHDADALVKRVALAYRARLGKRAKV